MPTHHEIRGLAAFAFSVLVAASSARADSLPSSTDLTPPPAEPASVCTATFSLGGPTSCKPQAIWDEYAKQDCTARGYPVIGAVSYLDACWKGFRSVDYSCCN
jgi:hypothetical protein